MLRLFNKQLRRFCSRLRWPLRRRSRPKIIVKKLGRTSSDQKDPAGTISSAIIHPSNELSGAIRPVRVATFNAALFSMAPVIPESGKCTSVLESEGEDFGKSSRGFDRNPSTDDRPKGILKQQKLSKSRLRVSINLPDNEISLKRSGQLSFAAAASVHSNGAVLGGSRTVLEVLRELDADVLALQDVKAEEEKNMKPLSELAEALGMSYVFAESWAPEYGNAILSKWPIKRWKAQKIFDDSDFRNVLKATVDVPQVGEMNLFCTLLDHLDEQWRMKQVNAIIESTGVHHILAGGLNSLHESDYSKERWTDIVKYYEEMGKPTPKAEVMKYLKGKEYTDAEHFSGECESVIMIARGQSVQGTCKYGTRVDYILSSPGAPYEFVPGSYSVLSSKGTSDHHIVKVDVIRASNITRQQHVRPRKARRPRERVVKITHSRLASKGIWKMHP